mgnify:FL=1
MINFVNMFREEQNVSSLSQILSYTTPIVAFTLFLETIEPNPELIQ